jgi:Domain of unknown function (DUF4263)
MLPNKEQGTRLMVVVKVTTEDKDLLSFLYKGLEVLEANGNPFVELVLKNNLELKRNTGNLQDCACFIPSLKQEAKSVNHAATLISENFEVARKSHTKDVFREAYFHDTDNIWKPLDKWREKVNPLFGESQNIRDITTRLNKKADNPSDFNKILELINISKEMAQAIVTLEASDDNKDIQVQKILNTLISVDKLKKILKIWRENQDNSSESFWHSLLAENSFVLAQLFSTPVTILFLEAYVGGKGIENTGGGVIDFLIVNKLTRNTSLIEIKTPVSRLLGGEYRNGIYSPSNDLLGAVTQVAANRDSLVKDYDRLVNRSRNYFEVFNPLCIVISGNSSKELSDDDKRRSFELYRSEHRNVQILTYDEVFEKVRTLIEILEGKD